MPDLTNEEALRAFAEGEEVFDVPRSNEHHTQLPDDRALSELAEGKEVVDCDYCHRPLAAEEAIENDHMHAICLERWCEQFVADHA